MFARSLRALLVVVGLSTALRAHAGVALQAIATASAGVTDNVASAPTTVQQGQLGRESDFILVLTPGLILTGGTPRAVSRLSYTFGGIIYGVHSEADTYTNTLSYTGFFEPTKKLTVGLAASLVQGRSSAFNTTIQSSAAPAQAQLTGVQNLLSAFVNENLAWTFAADWRLYQLAGFSTAYYLDHTPPAPIAQTVPLTLGIERRFARDAFSVEGNVVYTNFAAQYGPVTNIDGSITAHGEVQPDQGQIIATPLVRYRRDLTYFLSGRAELGAAVVFDPSNTSNHLVQPAGGLGLNFNGRIGFLDLSYTHAVAPNLVFLSNFLNDSIYLRGNLLFGERSRWAFQVGAGYTYGRELNFQAQEEARAHSIIADATLFYTPRREFTFFLRYQLIDQIAHNDILPVTTTVNGTAERTTGVALETYYRNTFLFGITATYPAEAAVVVPNSTSGVRADGRDDGAISVSKSTDK